MAIMVNEVPIAFFIGKLAKKTKTGIIKKPPPAPTNPDIVPINNPCDINGIAEVTILGVAKFFCLGFLIIFEEAANMTTEKNIIISLDFEIVTLLLNVIASGSKGSSCDRVKKTAKSDGMPNNSTILKFTFLSMLFLILPTADVLPTINSE